MNTNVNKNEQADELNDAENGRSRLVRVRRIVDSSIFGGWGVKL